MKAQEIKRNMKRNFIWILAVLMLIGLLGLASISLAVEDTWTTKGDMPTARFSLSTSVVDGKIYAIGGDLRGRGAPLSTSTVEEYDPATDTWTAKADMPKARYGLSTSVVDGKIYAFGGARTCVTPAFSTVEEYDLAMDTWTTKADMPKARIYFSTSAVNGKIYAIGGARQATWLPLRTVHEYSPAADTWTTKADMPKGKVNFSTSAVDGKIYAIGGSFAAFPWAPVSTVEEYDTGFVPPITSVDVTRTITSVDATGKLTTTWGKIK